jgi:hypothetical protein
LIDAVEWTAAGGLAGIGPQAARQWRQAVASGHQKDGDTYLRTLLIHGAPAVIRAAERKAGMRKTDWRS